MDPVITQIRQELKDHQDLEIRKTSQRFFKDEITCYGIKTAIVLAIAKKYWKVVQRRPRPEIYLLCDELYKSGYKCWTKSPNRWMRRAAAVSLIIPAKHGKFLKESLEIADILLTDSDDMVQKGYGWLLKEASRKHRTEVYDFVIRNKRSMPRTALRYAIELLPQEMKTMAMSKDW